MIPALRTAFSDKRLAWHEQVALGWLALEGVLDTQQWRPLKALTLQVGIGCRRRTSYETLARLTRFGYLHCGERDAAAPPEARQRAPRWYRLSYAAPPREPSPARGFPVRTTPPPSP
jgi:hypothetical protein